MSKEDKIKRKKERAFRRAKKHNEDYHKRISEAREIGYDINIGRYIIDTEFLSFDTFVKIIQKLQDI